MQSPKIWWFTWIYWRHKKAAFLVQKKGRLLGLRPVSSLKFCIRRPWRMFFPYILYRPSAWRLESLEAAWVYYM